MDSKLKARREAHAKSLRSRAAELRAMRQPIRAEYVDDLADQVENDWSRGWAREHNGIPETWGEWRTRGGSIVRAYRGAYNRVRFYDAKGQVGPEQRNVAPAIAYAMASQWEPQVTLSPEDR